MTIFLVFSALALSTGTSAGADAKRCDAKPFTLKKPVQTSVATPAPAPKPAPKPKPKKVVIGCKQPATKQAG